MFANKWTTGSSKPSSNIPIKHDGISTSLCTESAEAMIYVTYNDNIGNQKDKQQPDKPSKRLGRWGASRERPRRFVVKKLDSKVEWGEEGKELEPEEEESREPLPSSQTGHDDAEAVNVLSENNRQVVTKSIVLGKGVTLTLTLTVTDEEDDKAIDVAVPSSGDATKENTPPAVSPVAAASPAFDSWPAPSNSIAEIDHEDVSAIPVASKVINRTEDYDIEELDLEELEVLAMAMEDNYRNDLKQLDEGNVLVNGKEMEFNDAKSNALLLKRSENLPENTAAESTPDKETVAVAVAEMPPSSEEGGDIAHIKAIQIFEKITGNKVPKEILVNESEMVERVENEKETPKAHNVVSSVEYDTEGMVWADGGPSDTNEDMKPVVVSHVTYDDTEGMVWTDGPDAIKPSTTMTSSDKDDACRRITAKKDSWSDLPDANSDISPPSLDDMDSQELGAMALLGAEAEVEASKMPGAEEANITMVVDDHSSIGNNEEMPAIGMVVSDTSREHEGDNNLDASSAAAACQADKKEKRYTSDGETIVSKMVYTWANVLARTNEDLPLEVEFCEDTSVADSDISCWTEKRDAEKKAKEERKEEEAEDNGAIQPVGGAYDFAKLKEMTNNEDDFKKLADMAGIEVESESDSSEDEQESFESDDDFSC